MRETNSCRRWCIASAVALVMSAIAPGASHARPLASMSAAVTAVPMNMRAPITIRGHALATRHQMAAGAAAARVPRPFANPQAMLGRHIIQPHLITIALDGTRTEASGFSATAPQEESLTRRDAFQSFEEQRRGVLILRGSSLSVAVFPSA
jgi:hypothetical protein